MTDTPRSHGRKRIRPSLQPRDLLTPNPTLARAWSARVITLLPQAFPGVLAESLTGRALREERCSLDMIDLPPPARVGTAMSMTPPPEAARAWCCAPT